MKNQLLFLFLLLSTSLFSQNEIVLSTVVTDVSCYGGIDGAIDLTATGGTGALTYLWSNGVTTQDVNNLPAGMYTPTVTDATGQTVVTQVMVCQPPPIQINAAIIPNTNQPCNGGANITIIGGMPPYTYNWSNGQNIEDLNGACGGNYCVTVTDVNGCTINDCVSIPDAIGGNTPYFQTDVTDVICGDTCTGSIHVYEITGFTWDYVFEVSIDGSPAYTVAGQEVYVDGLCPYQTVSIFITGPNGLVYSIQKVIGLDFSNLDFSIISENNLPCNTPDQQGCELVCPHSVVHYGANIPNCAIDALKVWTVTGAESYAIDPDNKGVLVTWGDAGAGLVELTLQQQGICYYADPICVQIIDAPTANFTAQPTAAPNDTIQLCQGQSLYLNNTSTNADVFEWIFGDDGSVSTDDNPVHQFNSPGMYTVWLIARSNCLCADTVLLTVQVLATPSPGLNCVSTTCAGETVTYTVDSDCTQFVWSVGGGTVTGGGGLTDTSITIQWQSAPQSWISIAVQSCTGLTCPVPVVIPIPVLSDDLEIEGPDLVCPGDEEDYRIGPFDGIDIAWKVVYGGKY
ncbi:MAG: hypothetical protein IPL65_08510 [Lewinellaceae bacterium]|nr:hypothetical protein [Lewinellaceae bacterium]